MRTALVAAIALLLAACKDSSSKGRDPDRRTPHASTIDAAPAAPAPSQPTAQELAAGTADSTRCLVNQLASRVDVLQYMLLLLDRSPAVPRALAIALGRVTREEQENDRDLGAYAMALAERGDLAGARAVAAQSREVPGILRVMLGEDSDELYLEDVVPLVRTGQRDRAEKLFAAATPDQLASLPRAHGAALAALGKPVDPISAWSAIGWLDAAIELGLPLDAPSAAVTSTLGALALDSDELLTLIHETLVVGGIRGHGPALAPLRAAVRAIGAQPVGQYLAALLGEAPEHELAAIASTVATDERTEILALRAVWRGTPDEALAAIAKFDKGGRLGLYGMLWVRHVGAGLDPAVETALAAAICAPGCLIDRARGASIRVTADGGVVGGKVLVPAPVDRAAAAKAFAKAPTAACLERFSEHDPWTLRVVLTPTGRIDTALAIAGAGLDAGFELVIVGAVDTDDATKFSPGACSIKRAPAAPPDEELERIVLSVYLGRERTWIGQSRIDELQPIDGNDAAQIAAAIDEIGRSTFFEDRKDAELAADPDVPASELGKLVPLCERFPQLRLTTPDQLTAKPTL